MNLKKLYQVLLIGLLLINNSIILSYAAGTSWKLKDGILTISGNGTMDNYSDKNFAPWYNERDSITKVIVKNGVTSIGNTAFYDCNNLVSVELANSVNSIGDFAFLECEKLESVKMSTTVKSIGDASFKLCQSLSSIVLPEGLESIGYEAFFLCESLKTITIPSSVTNMEECVFTYCHGLVMVKVNAKIDTLPYWTFYDCENLTTLYLSDSITTIGQDALNDCDSLSNVSTGADQSLANKLTNQIKQDVSGFGTVNAGQSSSQDTHITIEGIGNNIYQNIVDNEDVFIDTTISNDKNINVDVTVKEDDGWDSVNNQLNIHTVIKDTIGSTSDVNVNINVSNNSSLPGELLDNLAGKNVIINLKGVGYKATIACKDLESNKKYKDVAFQYKIEKIINPSNNIKKAIGESVGYYLSFEGSSNIPMIIEIELDVLNIQDFASLFQKDMFSWEHIQTVRIDSNGIASFYFGGFDHLTSYIIGINVDGYGPEAIIPDDEYNGLTDAYGNRYEITGFESKWGLTIGQVITIMVIVMIVVIVSVGGAMYIMNKRKIELSKLKEEVFSKYYKIKRKE